MQYAFADRDFYYGDPYFPPVEPMKGLLSKEYAKARATLIDPAKNDADAGPGDPYPYEGKMNPYLSLLIQRGFSPNKKADGCPANAIPSHDATSFLNSQQNGIDSAYLDRLWRGT